MGQQGTGVGQVNDNRTNAGLVVTGTGATAMGGTDTAVIRYTAANVTDPGGAFTLVEGAAAGSVLTCVFGGLWEIELYGALVGAGALDIGISLNAAALGALTGSPSDFVAVDAGAGSMGVRACAGDLLVTAVSDLSLKVSLYLTPGDVIRFLATAAVTLDADNSRFFMTPIALDV